MALVIMLLAGRAAGATVLVPMSDEALVASSDAIVVGRVGTITTAALAGGRVVTRITLAVERALKGAAAGGSLVVTEDGGRIGRSAVVVFGAPEYTTGERVLAFLRRRADGSLETNGLAFLDKTDRAITKNIQGECGTGMKALVADLRTRATAAREGIQ